MKITTGILCLTALLFSACSQVNDFPEIYNADKAGAFPLLKEGTAASIWTDKDDYPVVGICAEFLADDIERVGQVRPQLAAASCVDEVAGKNVVIAGTIGHSALIDTIVSEGKIDVSGIEGKWESFLVTTLRKPFAGVDKAFVIVGSDRRGTAFGLTSLCEAIGVSPWYWWADVTPDTKSALFIQKGEYSHRNLCNPEERRRSGGAGVYYHISYHGDPDSWFWLSPLSPSFISTEMCKAYDYVTDRIWVFNVGDIKLAEKELSFAGQVRVRTMPE